MGFGAKTSQAVLVAGFLAILLGSPIHQAAVEMRQRRPVQATDLLHRVPTVRELRGFEKSLEDNWWGQNSIRPLTQRGLFRALRDTGAKAIEGYHGWLFYRPGVQYLTEADRMEVGPSDSIWASPPTHQTRRDSAVEAIVTYRNQLRQRGIELLIVPVPGKASVYPDLLTHRFADHAELFRSPTEDLLEELDQQGIATVNLFEAFRKAREHGGSSGLRKPYYLACDTHWTPRGVRVAAKAMAEGLAQLDWAPEDSFPYTLDAQQVARRGDILDMVSIPAGANDFSMEEVVCQQVRDPLVGLMIPRQPARSGRFKNDHLIDTPMESSVLLLGDSFCRIYQTVEPASLGADVDSQSIEQPATGGSSTEPSANTANSPETSPRKKKKLLPGSAGLPSLLAYELQAAVDYLIRDGGAATDVRQRLSVDPELLDNKRVVIWEFAERELRLGQAGWKKVPLPPEDGS